ncbi:hypothetical protein BURPS1710b_2844 [Burkholderia pseudomallei 1710b]|uniref:Uncharacterized protein n=1 Tax=Burkholderia pseudomallei (strain 1710b) TaxID=320372 RepID=Q3JQC5_BURP1|nr:hypothetical protein BURPS1710b_2844 [Burkholderia pseudomallei 1710b]
MRASHSGLPVSRPIIVASASLRSTSSAAKRLTIAQRASRSSADHAANARRALATARSTSSADAPAPSHTGSPVPGLREAKTGPAPSRQAPSMKSSVMSLSLFRFERQHPHELALAHAQRGGILGGQREHARVDEPRRDADAKIGERRVRHERARRVLACGGRADRDRHDGALAHGAQIRHVAFEHGARVEDVDVVLVAQPFGLEHLARGQRVAMRDADHVLRVPRQQVDVHRKARHQLREKRLAAVRAQIIGGVEVDLIEVRTDRAPERRRAVVVEVPAQLRADALRKAFAELRDEHEARARQQTADAARAVARAQEQRAHFGVARQIVRDVQQRHLRPHAEVLTRMDDRAHAVVVERLLEADFGFDAAHAGDVARLRIFHHEEIAGLGGRRVISERAARALDARGKRVAVRLERGEARPGFLRERDERVHVARLYDPNDDHAASPGWSVGWPSRWCSGTQRTVSPSATPSAARASAGSGASAPSAGRSASTQRNASPRPPDSR